MHMQVRMHTLSYTLHTHAHIYWHIGGYKHSCAHIHIYTYMQIHIIYYMHAHMQAQTQHNYRLIDLVAID